MKKLVISLIAVSLLSGCAVNHAPKAPLSQQTDQELCKSAGYAHASGNGEQILAIKHEIQNRGSVGRFSLSVEDCQIMVMDGERTYQADQRSNQMMLSAMQQNLDQMNQPQEWQSMGRTDCTPGINGGFNCHSY